MHNRLTILLDFLEKEPDDPFNRYALALEYLNINVLEAKKHFEILQKEHKNYLPLYYHLAKLYEDLEEIELALETYEKGIKIAQEQKNTKTEKELINAKKNCELAQ
jgi:tetratricopeptide (TPR) repeat protein